MPSKELKKTKDSSSITDEYKRSVQSDISQIRKIHHTSKSYIETNHKNNNGSLNPDFYDVFATNDQLKNDDENISNLKHQFEFKGSITANKNQTNEKNIGINNMLC